jgi:hypothetical protein
VIAHGLPGGIALVVPGEIQCQLIALARRPTAGCFVETTPAEVLPPLLAVDCPR